MLRIQKTAAYNVTFFFLVFSCHLMLRLDKITANVTQQIKFFSLEIYIYILWVYIKQGVTCMLETNTPSELVISVYFRYFFYFDGLIQLTSLVKQ